MSIFKNIQLVDAQQKAKDHPETFVVPSEQSLKNLKKNDTVKICDSKDRFWVIIEDISNDKLLFVGKIDNNLIGGQRYDAGDYIHFEKKNIYKVDDE